MISRTVLALNPGSTSTRAAVYRQKADAEPQCLWSMEARHPRKELERFARVADQLAFRERAIRAGLSTAGMNTAGMDALDSAVDVVVGRGGLLAPLPGGVYLVNRAMLDDLASARYGEHPCNLGAALAKNFADQWQVPACITDPVVTDELADVARITGLPGIRRRSLFHALSQRGAARAAAGRLGLEYEDARFIVAHLGGGVSIGAHDRGRVVEVTNALDGEGPFSPERTGALPLLPLLDMIERGEAGPGRLRQSIVRGGGMVALLGTNDLRRAEKMAESDPKAALALDALAYNIARHIGSMGPVLLAHGEDVPAPSSNATIDAVILTGGMARSDRLCAAIETRTAYLAPVMRITGLEEMETLALGGLRLVRGAAQAMEYGGGEAS